MSSQFPLFTSLNLNDKTTYNQLIAGYPSYSNISFAGMQIWYNLDNKLAISELDNNLVIYYHLSFDADNTGYSLIGVHKVDDSLMSIFRYLNEQNEPPRIIHVPKFVTEKIETPENFKIQEELDYKEYILSSDIVSKLEGSELGRVRRKVNRFIRETENQSLETKSLDLSLSENKKLIFKAILGWEEQHGERNDPEHTEHPALLRSLNCAPELGIHNLCLYIDDVLEAVCIYSISFDKKYVILHHLKVNYFFPYIFDYVTKLIADEAVRNDIPFINLEMDLGIESLREHKMSLRPVDYLRQYRISPAR